METKTKVSVSRPDPKIWSLTGNRQVYSTTNDTRPFPTEWGQVPLPLMC